MMAGRQVFVELPQPFGPGKVKLAFVEGLQILIVNVDGTLRAIANSCPHAGASLYGGKLIGTKIRCPSHGLLIDLETGCLSPGGAAGAQTYAIEEAQGGAMIALEPAGD
ncbi:MAG: Rieske 2Fe-2S domain-containing protein [Proteobacteria bacterium]|nr:Rieske 2Fe-2S domain-containing protein [Pseudomonadota bacterium]